MENKILISVSVPTIEKTYDVYVPVGKRVSHIMRLIKQSIKELSNGEYQPNELTKIYNDTGVLIKPNVLIKDSGLVNGTNIIII